MNAITIPNTPSSTFALTPDQEAALSAFSLFLMDPVETVFVLSGYSGCGKSTLVKTLLERLPDFMRTAKLINPSQQQYEVALTATTNKAAENLSQICGYEATTIHSFLGLRVQTDFKTNTTTLLTRSAEQKKNYLVFVDEYSQVDQQLLRFIFSKTKNCKIVFIGDPAQILCIKATSSVVGDAKFTGAALTQVVRQAEGNPIVELSTKFRNTVKSGEFFNFTPDGHHIRYMEKADFELAIEQEFTRPDWRHQDSKILAWTNKCVIAYNQFVRTKVMGDPHFAVGDYAVCNSFISVGKQNIKTDQLVQITCIENGSNGYGVPGKHFTLDYAIRVFMPDTLESKNLCIKQARADNAHSIVADIESNWVDLRAAYACTINKAQGSTYDKVFIDLDDIRRCNSGDQIARMLYVAVSRARNFVVLTGDLA